MDHTRSGRSTAGSGSVGGRRRKPVAAIEAPRLRSAMTLAIQCMAVGWVVLTDPEGNELLRALSADD